VKVSIPAYVVALVVALVYGLLKNWFPELPLTQDQVQWIFVTILGLLGVDVVNALKVQGFLK
jgi:branched-subunit amino acid permease